MFSPRPVLVEGVTDVAALATAIARTQPAAATSQTDLIECGGVTEVALWFQISKELGLDVRGVVDLDALFTSAVNQTMTDQTPVKEALRTELAAVPATVAEALKPLIREADASSIPKDPKSRAAWLSTADLAAGHESRVDKLLAAWKDAGVWVHRSGTLESVLNIHTKGVHEARSAAEQPGEIDKVAGWCAYALDPSGELEILVNVAVERVAHNIMKLSAPDPMVSLVSRLARHQKATGGWYKSNHWGPAVTE